MSVEMVFLAVDYQAYITFENDDDQVVLWSAWLGVYDVVTSFDFTRKNISLNISGSMNGFLTENDSRLVGFLSFLSHFIDIDPANLNNLEYWTKCVEQ